MDERGRRAHSLFGSCFFSKVKKRKKKQSSRGRPLVGPSKVHTCEPQLKSGRAHQGSSSMDSAFQGVALDTISGRYSVKLTEMVDNILEGNMPDINREHVMGFCKKLLVGDDKPPLLNEKSLPYIARVCTGDPPVWKVVVTVAQVTNNLKEVLVKRAQMYEQLHIVKDHIAILKICLKMIMSDPRKYTPDELGVVMNGTLSNLDDTTPFTYMMKPGQSGPGAKSGELALDEADGKRSPKRTKVYDTSRDILEGVEGLIVLKTSPPRTTIHASPRSRNISTGSSVMSQGSDVMSLDSAGQSNAARMLEEFYNDDSRST